MSEDRLAQMPINAIKGIKGFQSIDFEKRFYEKVWKSESCWLWTGANDGRYGQMWLDGRNQKAHRVAWIVKFGSIPEGMHVLHQCDNTFCVNIGHLFVGTHSDNHKDSARKGKNGHQKLSVEDVRSMRSDHNEGLGYILLGRKYGVHPWTAQKIIKRRLWDHV